jgi:hypothetical protein
MTHNTENEMEKTPERYEDWQKLTPWKEGDPRPEVGSLWVIVSDPFDSAEIGDVLRFECDDNTKNPEFINMRIGCSLYKTLGTIAPLPTEPAATEPDHAEYVERDGKKYPWVEVRQSGDWGWEKRILLSDFGNTYLVVTENYEECFCRGVYFGSCSYQQMRPIPRKKYRPYASLEECKHLIGEVLIAKLDASSKILVSSVRVTLDASRCFVRIVSNGNEYTMSYLLDHYTHNGKPCGVEV